MKRKTYACLSQAVGLLVLAAFAAPAPADTIGDGRINAFDPVSRSFLGQLQGAHGPLTIEGLWGLKFGNGDLAGDAKTLFFTAGISGGPGGQIEDHGLFGELTVVPEPNASLLLLAGLGMLTVLRLRRR